MEKWRDGGMEGWTVSFFLNPLVPIWMLLVSLTCFPALKAPLGTLPKDLGQAMKRRGCLNQTSTWGFQPLVFRNKNQLRTTNCLKEQRQQQQQQQRQQRRRQRQQQQHHHHHHQISSYDKCLLSGRLGRVARTPSAQVTRPHPQPNNHHHHEVATAFAQWSAPWSKVFSYHSSQPVMKLADSWGSPCKTRFTMKFRRIKRYKHI